MRFSFCNWAIVICLILCCFLVNLYHTQEVTQLSLGQPTQFTLQTQADSYTYYQLTLPSSISTGISFVLTPLSGGLYKFFFVFIF